MQSDRLKADHSPKAFYWHPFLFALFPMASIYVANASAVEPRSFFLPAFVGLVIALAIYICARLICPDSEKSAVIASWTTAWFFSFGILSKSLDQVNHKILGNDSSVHGEYVLLSWGIIWLAVAFWIYGIKRSLKSTNGFLTSMAIALLMISALRAGHYWYLEGRDRPIADSDSWLQPPIELRTPARPPDIYYLVFDRYAGPETLLQNYELDNSKFFEDLRQRGFSVQQESKANYPRTILSMCSALNLSYLPEHRRSDNYYAKMIDNHTVGRYLKEVGYKYYHFGNWYQPLRSNNIADEVYATSILPSEFAESLYASTPLSKLIRVKHKFDFVTNKLKEVAKVANDEKPTFVYAHFLLPHTPYVLNSDGSQLSWAESRYGDPKASYIKQLKGTNKLILEMIDSILSNSAVTPIIVLQADEGPYLTEETRKLDRKQQILTRARIFSAFLLPSDGQESDGRPEVPLSITPVNTFRLIFREYFDSNIDLLSDRIFYWDHADSLGRPASSCESFVEVTEELVAE